MKTLFFRSFDPVSEASRLFIRDLTVHLGLPAPIRAKLEEEYLNQLQDVVPVDKKRQKARADELGISLAEMTTSLDVMDYVTARLETREEDTPKALATDLMKGAPSASFKEDELIRFFSKVREKIIPKYKEVSKKRIFSVSVLPRLMAFDVSVALCPIAEHKLALKDPVAGYDPKISGYTPVVSVSLQSTYKNSEEFVFQVSPEALELLINRLQASLIDIKAFETFMKKA